MKFKLKTYSILLILIAITTTGFGCKFNIFSPNNAQPVTLNWWGVWETSADVADLINGFQTLHPTVTIKYKKFRYEEYENELLEAFAEDRGPDLYSIPATWIRKYQTKITPQPPSVTLLYQEMKGTLKKEPKNTTKKINTITTNQLRNQFVEVVGNDVIIDNQIYALPLSMDTLVLYYNRDLFNNFGIPLPPQTWEEFKETTKNLTLINQDNEIIQAGAALGTAENIPRANDICSILMLQNGAIMENNSGQITFNQIPLSSSDKTYNPGIGALVFYTDFANPIKEVYSWNNQMTNALEAFTSGKLAMFFGYSYHLSLIKNLAPKLNFSLTYLPQIAGTLTPKNYANYWVVTTAKKSLHPDDSWGFLNYVIQKDVNRAFLEKTKRPTAIKSLIEEQLNNNDIPELQIFANQVLTAKSWYHGRNPLLAENYFSEMIDSVVSGAQTPKEAIDLAAQQINSTL
jgi:ABC-type glycerol-3-phosphate transport system substrate-binding protein